MHYGADSLDLTIPAEARRVHSIEPGDVFALEISKDADGLVLCYKRVYSARK
ncbi:MAG: AbrB/MazE/SpoVT family DNA-binding domain-containing protein [Promethearchaeota archaeon]